MHVFYSLPILFAVTVCIISSLGALDVVVPVVRDATIGIMEDHTHSRMVSTKGWHE